MDEHETAAGLAGMAAAARGAAGAAPGVPDSVASATGALGSAQQAIGGMPRHLGSGVAPHRQVFPPATSAPDKLYARPEPDSDMVGAYMRDAIERGGYRAALEYYSSDEAKESDTPWHRLRVKGWLLGRLGLYGQLKSWFDEIATLPDFESVSAAGIPGPRTDYRAPALWLESPGPVRRRTDDIMTVEPAAAPCLDVGPVPDYIWTAMLILDAAGPICSHAGLGAAAFLAGAGADLHAPFTPRVDRLYDPLRGARLHGAPEGCHRWIIADMDFDPWLINEPHYYYDLTDEGRAALEAARAAGSPWQKAVEAAASGLGGMSLPDLLEGACRSSGPVPGLDKARDDLDKLLNAWKNQEKGANAAPVGAGDQVLVDLGATTRSLDAGGGAGSVLDHLLCLMTVVESTHTIACEAKPPTRGEAAVLEALIGAIQVLCRRHGGEVAASASVARPRTAPARDYPSERDEGMPLRPLHADATPALICDLYYCLAEYCRSRRLAVDPCSLPLSEQFTEDERAAVIEALTKDNPLYDDKDGSHRSR